jgi:hypothetical protein
MLVLLEERSSLILTEVGVPTDEVLSLEKIPQKSIDLELMLLDGLPNPLLLLALLNEFLFKYHTPLVLLNLCQSSLILTVPEKSVMKKSYMLFNEISIYDLESSYVT